MVQCLHQLNQNGALYFVILWWPTPEMSRITAFRRCPWATAWPPCSCTSTDTNSDFGLETLLNLACFVDEERLRLRWSTLSLRCFFFLLFWPMDHPKLLVDLLIATTVKSLFSAVLFLPPVVKAGLKLISASLFLAPGLCLCGFLVFFLLSRLFAVFTKTCYIDFCNLESTIFLPKIKRLPLFTAVLLLAPVVRHGLK